MICSNKLSNLLHSSNWKHKSGWTPPDLARSVQHVFAQPSEANSPVRSTMSINDFRRSVNSRWLIKMEKRQLIAACTNSPSKSGCRSFKSTEQRSAASTAYKTLAADNLTQVCDDSSGCLEIGFLKMHLPSQGYKI